MQFYTNIKVGSGDTAEPLNLHKRIRFLLKYISSTKARFLNCGCGSGEYIMHLHQKYGVDAWGVELLDEKARKFSIKYPDCFRVTRGDIQQLPYCADAFDLAMLNEVLEHVPNQGLALSEVYRILSKGGKVIVFSPNRFFPFETHGVYLRNCRKKIPPYIPFVQYVPVQMGEIIFGYWARNYWPWELRRLVKNAGFKIVESSYIWQSFENISGSQPILIKALSPVFRTLANTFEKVPILKCLGVFQILVAQK